MIVIICEGVFYGKYLEAFFPQALSARLLGLVGITTTLFAAWGYYFIRRKLFKGSSCGSSPHALLVTATFRLNLPLIITAVLLFALATAQYTLDVVFVYVAFVHHGGGGQQERLRYVEDVTEGVFIAKRAVLIGVLFVSDAFLVGLPEEIIHGLNFDKARMKAYRCWVVWNRNLLVVVPSVLFSIASTGMLPRPSTMS